MQLYDQFAEDVGQVVTEAQLMDKCTKTNYTALNQVITELLMSQQHNTEFAREDIPPLTYMCLCDTDNCNK